MTSTQTIGAMTLAGILIANAARAEDFSNVQILKPLHGISFPVGTKHAAGYFLSDNGVCKLVLTLADEPNWDEIPNFTATRHEAAIPAGKATQFNATEGKAIEFACQAGARAMSVKGTEQVTMDSAR